MNKYRIYLLLLARVLLGVMWAMAGFEKIVDPAQFSRDISNYHLLPFGLENTVAIVLPWLELFIGLSLIFGLYINSASAISGILMLIFIIFISQAMARGFNIECGCGLKEGQMVGWEKILENILYSLGSYFILIRKEKILEFLPKVRLSSNI
tara:strand:+ start:451 stop:906 length:456 start_codon:yes stop_codon:yes gene_type:complete